MSDGAILVLRHHGRGEGLPEPTPRTEEHHAENARAENNSNKE
jgi:hypothetical protein